MSSINIDDQKLVNKAVALLVVKAPMLTIPQSMCAAIFTMAQSEDRALQMQACRVFDIASKTSIGNHIGNEVDLASLMPSMSTGST